MAWPHNVTKKDLRIDYYRGSGAGGQHKNKTDSACRITHIPTGTVTQCEEQRKQHQNKKVAFMRLVNKLVPMMKAEIAKTPDREVNTQRIRTYNEHRQTVVDDRIKGKKFDYDEVLAGGRELDKILDNLL